jgi:hypothetical protein
MSDSSSEPPPIPQRREPPPIPESHEPPPVPEFRPAIPADRLVRITAVRAKERRASVVLSESPRRHPAETGVEVRPRPSAFGLATVLSWFGLLLMLACIPIALIGAFFPGLRSPFWLTVLMFSLVVISFEKFAKGRPQASADLVKLSLRLAYGFLFISLIGLAAAAVRAGVYISHVLDGMSRAVHKLAASWHESNGIIAWFLHKADVVIQFLAAHTTASHMSAPSPSPTATPAP